MNEKIEINISSQLNKELELLAAEEGAGKSELVKKAIEDYLFVRKFRKLRKKLSPIAKKQGFETDDDIFKAVS